MNTAQPLKRNEKNQSLYDLTKGIVYNVNGKSLVYTACRRNAWYFKSEDGKTRYWMNETGKLNKI